MGINLVLSDILLEVLHAYFFNQAQNLHLVEGGFRLRHSGIVSSVATSRPIYFYDMILVDVFTW